MEEADSGGDIDVGLGHHRFMKQRDAGFHNLVVPVPLWEFMEFCEVNCVASCCEDRAFDPHHSLVRRKKIDMNNRGDDGEALFEKAREQLQGVVDEVERLKAVAKLPDQLLIFAGPEVGLHQFQMNFERAPSWFREWQAAFAQATESEGGA